MKKTFTYFKQKFEEDKHGRPGPLKSVMDIFCAARVCNPTVMVTTPIEEIKQHLKFLCSMIPRIDEKDLLQELEGIWGSHVCGRIIHL